MKLLSIGGVFVLLIVGVAFAQDKAGAPIDGSLASLTSEVRLLRLAVEKGTQTQTQTQGLSVYLSAQQSRLVQLSTRVDALRRDVDAAAAQSGVVNDRFAEVQKALAGPLDAVERVAVTNVLATTRNDVARATERENQARNREAQASSELQTELARWSELIGRLEAIIRQ